MGGQIKAAVDCCDRRRLLARPLAAGSSRRQRRFHSGPLSQYACVSPRMRARRSEDVFHPQAVLLGLESKFTKFAAQAFEVPPCPVLTAR